MKKQIVLAALVLFTSSVVLTSCSKDEESPVITLTGGTEQSFDLGLAVDAGSSVADNKDDGLTATSDFATVVKKDEVNTYVVTYTATDESDNVETVTKTVKVKSDLLAGIYTATDIVSGALNPTNNGTFGYDMTVSQSATDYNKILFSNFGGFNASVYAIVLGTTFTIPAQVMSVPGIGSINVSGSGTYNGATKKVTSINYTTDGYGNGSVTLVKN